MLSRAIQSACFCFFLAVSADGRASLYDSFNGINIYSLMSLLFIASASGMPASNITSIDLKNETITNFDSQNNETQIINLNSGNKTTVSSGNKTSVLLEHKDISALKEDVMRLKRQIPSLETDSSKITEKIDKLTKEVSRLSFDLMVLEKKYSMVDNLSMGLLIVSCITGTLVFFPYAAIIYAYTCKCLDHL